MIFEVKREQNGAEPEGTGAARGLPKRARDGLERAWIDLLREKQPGVTWVIVDPEESRA